MADGFQADPELIGPDEARELLKNLMPDYRAADMRCVRDFASMMTKGQWLPRAEPLMYDTRHGLVGGRRRLLAVIEAGVEIEFLVMRGEFDSLMDFLTESRR
jgi:hypothetical protein